MFIDCDRVENENQEEVQQQQQQKDEPTITIDKESTDSSKGLDDMSAVHRNLENNSET